MFCRSFVVMSNYRHIELQKIEICRFPSIAKLFSKVPNLPYLINFADVSFMPYCATFCNMSYLPYFRYGSSQLCHAENGCINNYQPSLLNRFSKTMPEMARIYSQASGSPKICPVGKNLPGVCATGRVCATGYAGAHSPGSVNCLDHGSTHRIIRAVRFMSNLPHFADARPCRS